MMKRTLSFLLVLALTLGLLPTAADAALAETVIPSIEVYANKPVFDIEPDEPYIPDYMNYYVSGWYWSDGSGPLPNNFTVVGGVEYSLTVTVKPKDGYKFSSGLSAELFWDTAEIVTLEAHKAVIRASCIADMGTPNPFVDVAKTDYFYEAVIWAYYHEPRVTSGSDATHFSPKKDCTRAQIVTVLWHAKEDPAPASLSNPFNDVIRSKYYFKPIMWAYHSSPRITSGATATTFGVSKTCTREQAMTFLWKAEGAPEPHITSCAFTDLDPNKYYYKAVLWAVENKITGGASSTKFGVGKTCTRAQIVTFLYKAYGPKG